ncbi:hypothetical protein H3N56_11760 [Cetobacterium sp. 2A]|uniref:hypothetical protein n=1 Tax=unclassified Cetobacterium TaxID=2630983 RepID=UPI00163C4401|nr:hypothetical protein [Cetobacterium sp. 2A]MBC2857109.1 hypothetical protein [Cetobacterium sp. 2A]
MANLMQRMKENRSSPVVIDSSRAKLLGINSDYVSIIDYKILDVTENERQILIKCEEKAIEHAREIAKNTMELSKVFYEAQKTLSAKGNGIFSKWFEQLGFKKDFVYMCLKRNEIFLEVRDEKVFNIPERAIKTISKVRDKIDSDEILGIIKSDKPVEAAKRYTESLSGNPTNFSGETKEKLNIKLKEIQKTIREYEKLIKELKQEEEKVLKELMVEINL